MTHEGPKDGAYSIKQRRSGQGAAQETECSTKTNATNRTGTGGEGEEATGLSRREDGCLEEIR